MAWKLTGYIFRYAIIAFAFYVRPEPRESAIFMRS